MGVLVGSITLDEPGAYTYHCGYAGRTSGPEVVLAVGPSFVWEFFGIAARGLVAAAAGVLAVTPLFLLARHGGERSALCTRTLIERGPYAAVRHPQYLGYILLATGFALLSQHWLTAALAVAAAVLFHRQAIEEERACLARFGQAYARYMRRVPRLNLLLGLLRLLR